MPAGSNDCLGQTLCLLTCCLLTCLSAWLSVWFGLVCSHRCRLCLCLSALKPGSLVAGLKLQSSQSQRCMLLHTIAIKLNQAHAWWQDNGNASKPDKAPNWLYASYGATGLCLRPGTGTTSKTSGCAKENFINFRLMSAMCAISLHLQVGACKGRGRRATWTGMQS